MNYQYGTPQHVQDLYKFTPHLKIHYVVIYMGVYIVNIISMLAITDWIDQEPYSNYPSVLQCQILAVVRYNLWLYMM